MQQRNPSAIRRLRGRKLQERRKVLIVEKLSTCEVCRLVTPPRDLVLDHHPKPLSQWDSDPLLLPEWRQWVRLICVGCHDRAHGVRLRIGVDGWPVSSR